MLSQPLSIPPDPVTGTEDRSGIHKTVYSLTTKKSQYTSAYIDSKSSHRARHFDLITKEYKTPRKLTMELSFPKKIHNEIHLTRVWICIPAKLYLYHKYNIQSRNDESEMPTMNHK